MARGNQPPAARNERGFSLTELLVTMAILALAGTIVVTGIPAAYHAYTGALDASNAQVLLSTTATRLRDELSVADPTTVEAKNTGTGTEKVFVTFDSLETGYTTTIQCGQSNGARTLGINMVESVEGGYAGAPRELVPKTAAVGASNNLTTVADSITFEPSTGVFTIENLQVIRTDDSGGQVANATIDSLQVRTVAEPPKAASS